MASQRDVEPVTLSVPSLQPPPQTMTRVYPFKSVKTLTLYETTPWVSQMASADGQEPEEQVRISLPNNPSLPLTCPLSSSFARHPTTHKPKRTKPKRTIRPSSNAFLLCRNGSYRIPPGFRIAAHGIPLPQPGTPSPSPGFSHRPCMAMGNTHYTHSHSSHTPRSL